MMRITIGVLALLGACGSDPSTTSDAAGSGTDGSSTTAELVWFSDWRTATGGTEGALFDGGKWNAQLCNVTELLEVVPATGLEMPTTNALRVTYDQPSRCMMLRALQRWRSIAVGEYLFVRVYYRNAMPDGSEVGFPHPIHLGEGVPYTTWVNFFGPMNGASSMTMQMTGTHEWPDSGWSYAFATHQTYRLEIRLHRTGDTTGKLAVRVYDASGALVGDESAWHNGETGANSRTLAQSDPTVTVNDGAFELLDMGNNDPSGLVGGAARYIYFGGVGVAISSNPDAWPGPYPSATEAQ